MKRICFIINDISMSGGLDRVNAALASALAEDYEVWIASLVSGGKNWYPLDPRICVQYFHKEGLRLRQAVVRLHTPLKRFIRERDFDLVVLQDFYPCIIVSPLRLLTRSKFIFCDHGALRDGRSHPTFMRRMGSILCHRTVVLTERNLEDYVSRFWVPRKKLCYIPNWIDFSLPHSENYRADSKRILAAGRFAKEKQFDVLLRAFHRVVQKHSDWSLDLYGDGELMPQLQELVLKLKLTENVRLPGMCSDLLSRYGDYSMCVLSSYREGLPLVLLEAKLNRLPIVSFDIATGPREIVRHEIDGLLVPPGNEGMLYESICRLIEDPKLRMQMSQRSHENTSQFDRELVLAQWENLIEELTVK